MPLLVIETSMGYSLAIIDGNELRKEYGNHGLVWDVLEFIFFVGMHLRYYALVNRVKGENGCFKVITTFLN